MSFVFLDTLCPWMSHEGEKTRQDKIITTIFAAIARWTAAAVGRSAGTRILGEKAGLLQRRQFRETQTQNWAGLWRGCVMMRWNRREIMAKSVRETWLAGVAFHAFTHV